MLHRPLWSIMMHASKRSSKVTSSSIFSTKQAWFQTKSHKMLRILSFVLCRSSFLTSPYELTFHDHIILVFVCMPMSLSKSLTFNSEKTFLFHFVFQVTVISKSRGLLQLLHLVQASVKSPPQETSKHYQEADAHTNCHTSYGVHYFYKS